MSCFHKSWTKVLDYVDDDYFYFRDVIFYKGLVYATGRWNKIVSFDICNSKNSFDCEKIIPNVVSPWGDDFAHRAYFVKSLEGDLWLVRKFIGFPDDDTDDEDSNLPSSGTKRFEVYKLELDLQSGKLFTNVTNYYYNMSLSFS